MILARILLHTTILAVALNLIHFALINQYVPVAHAVLDWLSPGYYCVFSLVVAFLINRRPAMLASVLALLFILGYQAIAEELGRYVIAVLLGVLAARGVLALAGEAIPGEGA